MVDINFLEIYKSFDDNMQAFFILYQKIEEDIGTVEWGELKDFYEEIFSLEDGHYDPVDVQLILERLANIDKYDETLDIKKVWRSINEFEIEEMYELNDGKYVMYSEYKDALLDWVRHSPSEANRFFLAFTKLSFRKIFKVELARQALFISVVSQFEMLLLHLLRAYYFHFERDDGVLEQVSRLEELDEYISEKINKGKPLRYFSVWKRLDFLVQKFPLGNQYLRKRFAEIYQRRNVFVHRNGRADDQYIEANENMKIGDKLRISRVYMLSSLENLHLWGMMLCQRMWLKAQGADVEIKAIANRTLVSTSMQILLANRNRFCAEFCQYSLDNNLLASRQKKDMLRVNYAVSLDRLGDEDMKKRVVGKIRNHPSQQTRNEKLKNISTYEPISYSILMASNLLGGNLDRGLEFLVRAFESNEINFLDMELWPIFDYLADNDDFEEIKKKAEAKTSLN